MLSRWLSALLLVLLLSSIAFSQKLINGFTRELAIHGLPVGFSLKSFDVTSDSVSDLFVITSNQLLIFDGKTFSMIFKDSVAPSTANLSPADVNRDGSVDLVANSSDTAVVVWYGPDFFNRRVFPAPQSGFGAFVVRNREDGQVEFSFGFEHIHYVPILCTASYTDSIVDVDGHILRYTDTTFIFSDSNHLDGSPPLLKVGDVTGSGASNVLFVSVDEGYNICMPSYYHQGISLGYLNSMVNYIGSFDFYKAPYGPCPFPPSLVAQSIGNIDSDSGSEFVGFATQFFNPCWTPASWDFRAYDMLTSTLQWRRTDSLGIITLLMVDLNGDGIQELLSYEIQNANPGLGEYRTSDGTTLGFTELPFTPSTILMGLFGEPTKPKVLLGNGDSLVVYSMDVATDVREVNGKAPLPTQLTLWPAVPNPFNSQMSISYSLPFSGFVHLEIVDILGRKVKSLVSTNQRAGRYQATWDGTDNLEKPVGSGVYLAVLKANGVVTSQKIVFLK